MTISFVIPYVPIPRIIKRINIAKKVSSVELIYWDRGTESSKNIYEDSEINVMDVKLDANEGSPFKRLSKSIRFSAEVIKQLLKVKPKIIHVTKTDMLFAVFLYSLLTLNKSKVVYEVSDIHKYALNDGQTISESAIKKILFYSEKVSFLVVDKLIVTSPYFYNNYYEKLINYENVVYLPNTPEEDVFKKYVKKNNSRYTVAYIGKVRYVDQIKKLIDVSKDADIDVLIAGNGIGLEEIRDYSKNFNNVYIHGSYNYDKEIAHLYSMADAIYSVYDTKINNVKIALPNRLYEAAYCGLPLLVSQGTYLEQVIHENELGVSIAPDVNNDLLNKILYLKNENTDKYIINGKKYYKKFNSENNNIKLNNMYKKMLK